MTIRCKGQLIDLSTPKVMGILNVTPNSFFDGGKYKNESEILSQVSKMLIDGATFIDIGAYSSKPNADFVSEEEELQRIVPIVNLILENFPETLISIDTFRS
jgi:dihydropteroate synthase